jgi:tetratricopeptide (TPR) repeat protein
MKAITKISVLMMIYAFTLTFSQQAEASDYQTTMKQTIGKMQQSNHPDSLNQVAATFYRIAQTQPKEWLPYYYASFCYVSVTFSEKDADAIHSNLDKAQQMLELALKVNPNESEIHVLQGLIYSKRITDMGKGYKYSTLSNEVLAKAEALNPNNPRIYFCKGQNVMNTPAMFGGGKAKALPLFEKALALFEKQTVTNDLMPNWGYKPLAHLIKVCRED